MPHSAEQQFNKAILLLDKGEFDRGEAILRSIIAEDAAVDEVLRLRAQCCLGELLVELQRPNEAKPLLEAVTKHQPSSDLNDALDFEQRTARNLLRQITEIA